MKIALVFFSDILLRSVAFLFFYYKRMLQILTFIIVAPICTGIGDNMIVRFRDKTGIMQLLKWESNQELVLSNEYEDGLVSLTIDRKNTTQFMTILLTKEDIDDLIYSLKVIRGDVNNEK